MESAMLDSRVLVPSMLDLGVCGNLDRRRRPREDIHMSELTHYDYDLPRNLIAQRPLPIAPVRRR